MRIGGKYRVVQPSAVSNPNSYTRYGWFKIAYGKSLMEKETRVLFQLKKRKGEERREILQVSY